MSVVSVSLFGLKRSRRALEKAFKAGDWAQVRRYDGLIAEQLNEAFNDSARDTRALIRELQLILKAYATIVEELPENSADLIMRPDFSI